jgi:hypothetical protein
MATDAEVTSAVSAQSMAGKNFVINGGFDIFQRAAAPTSGTTVSGGSGYSIDRWIVWNTAGNGSIVTSRQLSGLTGIQYCARIQRPSGNTSGLNFFAQPIETSNSILLAGKTFTFSFYARKGADYSNTTSSLNVEVWQNTTTDGSIQSIETGSRSTAGSGVFVLTTSWQRFTFTSTFLSTTTQVAPVFYGVTSGTAGANDYYEITGVQLELSPAASTFSRAGGDIQGELAKCQRYYQVIGGTINSFPLMGGYSVSGTDIRLPISFPVQMRTAPSISKNGTWEAINVGQPSAQYISSQGFCFQITSTGTGTWYTHPNSTDDTMLISAEL